MLPTTIRAPPSLGDYVPLAEYQSQTPASFLDGKPVLHSHLVGARATAPKAHCGRLAIFPEHRSPDAIPAENGRTEADEVVEQTVDVFANSENLVLFNQQTGTGLSIPYPAISVHAVKQVSPVVRHASQAVWMQLEFSTGGDSDEDLNTLELTVTPTSPPSDFPASPAVMLYEAIASCSNLHPDPCADDDDEDDDAADRILLDPTGPYEVLDGFTGVMRGSADGGLPPPVPGSGGWITAENAHEYFDEAGNWIGGGDADGEDEGLGQGAGRVRPRGEVEATEAVNGHAADHDADIKRPRV